MTRTEHRGMVAERLRSAVARKGVTWKEVAESIGTSIFAVESWHFAARTPNAYHVTKLAEYFGVSAGYFLDHKWQ